MGLIFLEKKVYEKKCEFLTKKRFNNAKDAETALLLIGCSNLLAYKCGTCKGWHLTSEPLIKKNLAVDIIL